MVQSVIDPVRPISLTLSQREIEELQEQIDLGQLPPDFLDRCEKARQDNVFGIDHKTDRNGVPIEQGRGSPGNQTRQSIEAYRKWCMNEPNAERTLARMEKEFAESEARRKAEASTAPKKKSGMFQR